MAQILVAGAEPGSGSCVVSAILARRSATLPQYYFHLFNDEELRDEAGQDLPDLASAREAAVQGISELIAEHLAAGKAVDLGHRIDVEDKDGQVATRVIFKDLFVYLGEPLSRP